MLAQDLLSPTEACKDRINGIDQKAPSCLHSRIVCGWNELSVRIREIFMNLGGFPPQPAGPAFQRATV